MGTSKGKEDLRHHTSAFDCVGKHRFISYIYMRLCIVSEGLMSVFFGFLRVRQLPMATEFEQMFVEILNMKCFYKY